MSEKRSLVGARGQALTDLRPVGKIELEGRPSEPLEARAVGSAIDRGTRVRVVETRSGRLVVDADPGSSPSGAGSAGAAADAENSAAQETKGGLS